MQGLVTATLDRAFPQDVGTKGAPEWVHLLPSGVMQGRDGRTFDLADPGGLILAFQANGIDLPVDYEHQNDKPEARLKGPVPAAGWIKQLQLRDDGIWGRVEWTATAAEMISAKEYRYISPSILHHPKTREIMRLKGAGLVHNPNLHLTALNAQEETMPPSTAQNPSGPNDPATLQALLHSIIAFFGLPADATVDQVMAALKAVKDQASAPPDPAKYMPVAAVQAMLEQRKAERGQDTEKRIAAKVEAAVRDHYITLGMKSWALDLCRSDEAAFDTFCEGTGPTFAYLFKPAASAHPPIAAERYDASPLEAAICEQLGLKPGSLRD